MCAQRAWRREELAYCSNVHPGATLNEVQDNVRQHVSKVRQLRHLSRMHAGLWLPARVAQNLAREPRALSGFYAVLEEHGIDLVTLNGFPFSDFHSPSVKQRVYRPNWATRQRLDYTLNLAQVLSACLPDGHAEGTISTLPLGYETDWSDEHHSAALDALCKLCTALDLMRQDGHRSVRVCLEMEPGCVLETTADAIGFFTRDLAKAASARGISTAIIARHLGVCFDVCHQAVQFENVQDSLQQLQAAGITVGKVQLSSALEVALPAACKDALTAYDEPRYLHQTRCRRKDGSVIGVDDLPEALAGALPDKRPWRIHYHVPLQAQHMDNPALATTRSAVEQTLAWLSASKTASPHLEVETYTWSVLPEALRPSDDQSLHRGIAAELAWVDTQLDSHQMLASD